MSFLQTLNTLDTNLLIWMRSFVDPENPILNAIIRYGGEIIVVIVPAFLIFLWLRGLRKKENTDKEISLGIFYGIIFSFVLYAIINFFVPQFRPSPQEVSGAIAPIIDHPLDNSFPSGHAIFGGAFLMGLILFHFPRKLIWGFTFFLIITLISRIIGGVHYPGDILAGIVLGFCGVFLFQKYILKQKWFERVFISPVLRIASWIGL